MAPYSPPTGGRRGKLRLDFNENTVGCSPKVVSLIARLMDPDFFATYPEYSETVEVLAGFLRVPPDRLLLTNGTDEAIHCLIRTYVEAGDEVLIPSPAYSMYRFYTELAGAEPRAVPYELPELAFPLEALIESVSQRTRAVLISNPNNPTGGAIGLAEIEKLLASAGDAAVLIDEAYFEFHGLTALGLLDAYPNLFVSRTFSKAYGMAGFRIGCLLSQAENIALVSKGQSPYSVNALAAACAAEAVGDQEYIREYVAEALDARRMLCEGLDRLGVGYFPSRANFVLARFGERSKQICETLRQQGILIRDRGGDLAGTARITAGTRKQTERLLASLEQIVGSEDERARSSPARAQGPRPPGA